MKPEKKIYFTTGEGEVVEKLPGKVSENNRVYYRRQRLCGLALLILTALVWYISNGDLSIGLITIPAAFLLIFTKDQILIDKYSLKTMIEEILEEDECDD